MAKGITLNKEQQAAADFLLEFATNLQAGMPTEYQQSTIRHLEKMGISITFISHKQVQTLVRGKEHPFEWDITDAPWYIRGRKSSTYLPFQIKELKEKQNG